MRNSAGTVAPPSGRRGGPDWRRRLQQRRARSQRTQCGDLGRPVASASSGQRAAVRRGDAADSSEDGSPAMTPEPASMAQDQQEPAAPPRAASRTSGNLKRVSFGSLKGSMVETLVYQDQGPAHELAPLLNG
ncbi:hypothetical protein HPB52_000618 [Rhipicephalus sanguineus]|uniref:Uncharacterized protein n=1 Tax=Rhipicephalus sanguineus TaxID=34632 RepID=A0A9D4T4L6_RHISA|nr:hypothetical protein HPB52_000618 [Rhipicephalus sanguineus]